MTSFDHKVCIEMLGVWDDYRSGKMRGQQREEFAFHLRNCETCRMRMGSLARMKTALVDTELEPFLKRRLEIAVSERALPTRRLNHSRLPWTVAAGATLACAVLVVLLMSLDSRDGVQAIAPTQLTESASISEIVSNQIQVSTVADGRQVIEVAPGTALWMSDDTSVQIENMDAGQARFRLFQGKVVAEVAGENSGFRFVIATSSGEVEVRGTIFSVEVDASLEQVRVYEGLVEVRTNEEGTSVLVGEGQELVMGENAPKEAETAALESDFCLVRACTVVAGASSSSEVDARFERGKKLNAAATLIDEIAGENSDGMETKELLAKIAREYRHAKMYRLAADAYRRLILEFPGTDAAINGSVSLAQLEQGTLGEPGSALVHFREYLDRRQNGFLAETARAGIVRSLHKLGRPADLIQATNDYAAFHPAGISAAEMLRRRGDAHYRLGNKQAAYRDYREVITRWPQSPEATKASSSLNAFGVNNK